MTKILLASIHVTLILSFSSLTNAGEYCYFELNEIINNVKNVEPPEGTEVIKTEIQECNTQSKEKAFPSKNILEKFWNRNTKNIRSLFTNQHNRSLKTESKTVKEKYRDIFSPELHWDRQEYILVEIQGNEEVKITQLATWFQEGYEGVVSFIFKFQLESGSWKINKIFY